MFVLRTPKFGSILLVALLFIVSLAITIAPTAAAAEPRGPRLIGGEWMVLQFDQGDNGADVSGNGRSVSAEDGATYTSSGKFDWAASFDGWDDNFRSWWQDTPGSDMTVMMWINPTATNGYRPLMSNINAYGFELALTGGKVRFTTKYENVAHSIESPITTNVWTHVAATNIHGIKKLYVNGLQVTSASPSQLILPNAWIGLSERIGFPWDTDHFGGKMDEVRVYNRELTSQEIGLIKDNPYETAPTLTSPSVTPSSGRPNTNFQFKVRYADSDGDNPSYVNVVIDGSARTMSLSSGSASNGDYTYSTQLPVGSHTYYFEASDGRTPRVTTSQSTVSVTNSAPSAPAITSPVHGATNVAWNRPTLDWGASTDPDGDAITYDVRHSWGGQICAATTSTQCTWEAQLGRGENHCWYPWATDSFGAASNNGACFTTRPNQAPSACFGVTTTDLSVEFASCSSDPDGDSLSYEWDFGDGDGNWGNANPTHWYSCENSYTARLTVYDSYNSASSTTTRTFTPTDPRDGDADGLKTCWEEIYGTSDSDPDSDDDAIGDLQETPRWSSYNAVYCKGSTCSAPAPTQKDLYVEVDWYTGQAMTPAARDAAVNAYAQANRVRLHVDTGQFGDGGTDLGLNGNVPFSTAIGNRQARMPQARQPYFHYAVMACQDPQDAAGQATGNFKQGEAEAPGKNLVLYNCQITGSSRDTKVASILMHELGHNALGYYVPDDRTGGTCGTWKANRNPALSSFNFVDQGAPSCDTNANQDRFVHTTDTNDAMYGNNGLLFRLAHSANTWNAFRLDSSFTGAAAATCVPSTLLPTVLVAPCTSHADRAHDGHDHVHAADLR